MNYYQTYEKARSQALREYNKARLVGKYPYLLSLDSICVRSKIISETELGQQEIPLKKIRGTATESRAYSFASNFMPLLRPDVEFAGKWIQLCSSHMTEGIRDAISVYEYLGYYYVIEGNKRVSILKYFGAATMTANVTRLVPHYDRQDPIVRLYYAYMDFYKKTSMNELWFSREEGFVDFYGLMEEYGWQKEIEKIRSFYYIYRKLYHRLGGDKLTITTADSLLKYLHVYGYQNDWQSSQIRQRLIKLWPEFQLLETEEPIVALAAERDNTKNPLWDLPFINYKKKRIKVAFINTKDEQTSNWTYHHLMGIRHIEDCYGERVAVEVINHINDKETAVKALEEVTAQGNQLIFTTSPIFIYPTVKAALEHKDVNYLNCSQNLMHQNIRTYFGRLHEPSFLTGMVAGALTKTDKVGYLASFATPEFISSMNAFALGARWLNPMVEVHLLWTSEVIEVTAEQKINQLDRQLVERGVDYVLHQEATGLPAMLKTGGLYDARHRLDKPEDGFSFLAMPIWNWGSFYEMIVKSVLEGDYQKTGLPFVQDDKTINYWWGLESEMVDFFYSKKQLPSALIKHLDYIKRMMINGHFRPFEGELVDNHQQKRLTSGERLTTRQIMTMDWLVEGIIGRIPAVRAKYQKDDLLSLSGVNKRYDL